MIPRHLLPQIPKEKYAEFVDFVRSTGTPMSAKLIQVSDLKPIQAHVNTSKIDKIKQDKSPLKIPLIVSDDGFILDGHHRWIAAKELNPNGKILCIVVSCNLKDLIKLGHDFDGSFIKTVYEVTTYGKQALESYDTLIVRKFLKPIYEDDSYTDCRNDDGITVGLIDGLISILRVLKNRDLSPEEVKQALLDLSDDEDLKYLLTALRKSHGR